MARVFIISNRVGIPNAARDVHAGGLEVALRATLKRHACVWLGWSGAVKPAGEMDAQERESRVRDRVDQSTDELRTGFPKQPVRAAEGGGAE